MDVLVFVNRIAEIVHSRYDHLQQCCGQSQVVDFRDCSDDICDYFALLLLLFVITGHKHCRSCRDSAYGFV
jgi:hypothetical protein